MINPQVLENLDSERKLRTIGQISSDSHMSESTVRRTIQDLSEAGRINKIVDKYRLRGNPDAIFDFNGKKYDVLIIDPPWPYRSNGLPYESLSISELEEIRLPAKDTSILWVWCTNQFMSEAHYLLREWGFTEKTILTWIKDFPTFGHYLANQTEHCILSIKGGYKTDLYDQTTTLYAKPRQHSRKPDEFYDLVNEICPGSKCDIFSREQRGGFDSYGDQTDTF